MKRDQLEHIIRAACDMSDEDELYIFGSQAILGTIPESTEVLMKSMEADVTAIKRPEEATDIIDGNMGEDSLFHETYGYYAQGSNIHTTATLPEGWQERCEIIANENTRYKRGHCVEIHDLAVSKLAAFRDKDKEFVRELLLHQLVKKDVLLTRIEKTPCDEAIKDRMKRWLALSEV